MPAGEEYVLAVHPGHHGLRGQHMTSMIRNVDLSAIHVAPLASRQELLPTAEGGG